MNTLQIPPGVYPQVDFANIPYAIGKSGITYTLYPVSAQKDYCNFTTVAINFGAKTVSFYNAGGVMPGDMPISVSNELPGDKLSVVYNG